MRLLQGVGTVAAAIAVLVAPSAARAAEVPAGAPEGAVPSAQPSLVAGVRAGDGPLMACAGLAQACTIDTPRGRAYEVRVTPVEAGPTHVLEVAVTWRAPGARRLAPRRTIVSSLVPEAVGRRLVLPAIVRASGTWCLAPRLLDAAGAVVATAAPSCVRHRPAIELGWAGDIVVGSHYGLPPNGGRDQFDAVDHLLRAPDLMIGNYEGTLSRGGSPRCGGGGLCYLFQAPPERARNLAAAGFDVMSLANNHALDYGAEARRQTVRALARVGVRSAGLPGQVTTMQVEDTTVAIVGISPYPGTTNMRSRSAVQALVAQARRRADIVVVCMHVGLEGEAGAHVPRGLDYGTDTRGGARAAIDAGADVVFGSGPHVVRGVERYRGRYVVYSSGNFAGWRNFGLGRLTSQSGVVRMTFDHRGRPQAAAWDGVVLRDPGTPHPDRTGAVVRRVASLSRADFGRAGARFTASGAFR